MIWMYLVVGLGWAYCLDRVSQSMKFDSLRWYDVLFQAITWPYSIYVFMMAIVEANEDQEEE